MVRICHSGNANLQVLTDCENMSTTDRKYPLPVWAMAILLLLLVVLAVIGLGTVFVWMLF